MSSQDLMLESFARHRLPRQPWHLHRQGIPRLRIVTMMASHTRRLAKYELYETRPVQSLGLHMTAQSSVLAARRCSEGEFAHCTCALCAAKSSTTSLTGQLRL